MSYAPIIATGSYTGNGSSQGIAIGWQPSVVWVFSTRTTGPSATRAATLKLPGMAGATSLACPNTAVLLSDAITITSTGFTVGGDDQVNRSGTTFYYMVVRASPAIAIGSYTGDGLPVGQGVTTGFQPSPMWVAQTNLTERLLVKSPSLPAAQAAEFAASAGIVNALAITSTGFTAQGNGNLSTAIYDYAVGTDQVPTQTWRSGTYAGNDAPQTITLGEQPKFVQIVSGNEIVFKAASMPGAGYSELTASYAWISGPSGVVINNTGFQLNSSTLNELGKTYYYTVGMH